MTIWIDAHLSPSLPKRITEVLTKDADFPQLLAQHGPPPKVLWLTRGNASDHDVRRILSSTLSAALRLLGSGESIVEITGSTSTSPATHQPRGRG